MSGLGNLTDEELDAIERGDLSSLSDASLASVEAALGAKDLNKSPSDTLSNVLASADAFSQSVLKSIPVAGSYYEDFVSKLINKPVEEVRQFSQQLAKENPMSSGIGTATGIGAQFFTPSIGLASADRIKKIAKLMKVSPETAARFLRTAEGAAVSGGETALSKGTSVDDALISAALGGGLSGGLEGLQAFLGGKRGAEQAAVSALRGKDSWNEKNFDDINRLGRVLLDEGIVTPFASRKEILKRIRDRIDTSGKIIGDKVSKLNVASEGLPIISRRDSSRRVFNELLPSPQMATYNKEYKRIGDWFEEAVEKGDLSADDAHKMRKELRESFNPRKDPNGPSRVRTDTESKAAELARAEHDVLGDILTEQMVDRVSLADAKEFNKARRLNRDLRNLEEPSLSGVSRETMIGKTSPLVPGIGAYGIVAGLSQPQFALPVAALVTGGAFANKYGSQLKASALNKTLNQTGTALGTNSLWDFIARKEEENERR